MSENHIFLSIFLPDLAFDATPQLSFEDLRFFLDLNLSSSEQKVLRSFLTFYDLENVRSWILQMPMTVRGSIPHETLKDRLSDGETGIPVVDAFLKKFPTQDERVHNLPTLSKLYIKPASQTGHPFLKKYFFFENRIRRILSTFRAETSVPPFQLTSEELSSPEYHALYRIWKKRAHSYAIEREIAAWKFLEIERLGQESPPFSFDRILSYLIRLLLVESRQAMKEPIYIKSLEQLAKVTQ
jgi:hypothetical protein